VALSGAVWFVVDIRNSADSIFTLDALSGGVITDCG
jgi:hypothetical protein